MPKRGAKRRVARAVRQHRAGLVKTLEGNHLMKNSPMGWRVQLTLGAIGVMLAIAAGVFDLINNVTFGIAISPVLAGVMVLAAVGVIYIPAAAAARGWTKLYLAGIVIALGMTTYAGYNAYSSGQQTNTLAAQTVQANYKKAEEKRNRALEVLNSVKVTGTAKELGILAAKADANLAEADATSKRDCKKPRSEVCKIATEAKKQADAEAKRAHERLSQAEARDEAKADLAEAEAKAASGQAIVHEENRVMELLALALTQIMALIGGEAMTLIGAGWNARPVRAPKTKKTAAPDHPKGGKPQPLPANVVPLDAHKHSVKAWLDGATQGGGDLRGGDALKSYKRWAGRMAQNMTAGELRAILTGLLGEAVEGRTSGYVVRGISLRIGTAAQTKAAASC